MSRKGGGTPDGGFGVLRAPRAATAHPHTHLHRVALLRAPIPLFTQFMPILRTRRLTPPPPAPLSSPPPCTQLPCMCALGPSQVMKLAPADLGAVSKTLVRPAERCLLSTAADIHQQPPMPCPLASRRPTRCAVRPVHELVCGVTAPTCLSVRVRRIDETSKRRSWPQFHTTCPPWRQPHNTRAS
ncbi:hypothetical protein B0H19DRAFT_1258968 [Mycena capillaripes]|nr:hypothetical protein B0H19DRAFT_1258968 [Mycena capillaripes]